jgi:hypothetical protein
MGRLPADGESGSDTGEIAGTIMVFGYPVARPTVVAGFRSVPEYGG